MGVLWHTSICASGQDCNPTRNYVYDIEVFYLNEIDNQQPCDIDSLLIIVEGYFNDDLIQIYINGEIYYESNITSDESTGIAETLYVDNYSLVNSVGVSVNKGKMAHLETDNQCKPIGIRFDYVRKVLQVLLYSKAPLYY
ncbi:hypothetical protein EV194_105167 [Natronoflexus pectinivorans]|uniref:Uncharacterized protein n=2 Tax=Natronoflexus pectinivorans TaxID=682526 RepID=A0A4R2GJ78_9BACT|nr:hypothetical protein EV194_105167 [Natronoflexus pectinivorans]